MTTLSSLLNYITGIKVKLNVTPLYCGHYIERTAVTGVVEVQLLYL